MTDTRNEDDRPTERQELVRRVARDFEETAAQTGLPTVDPRIADALRRVPRHVFVDDSLQGDAYCDAPLPIGCGQTISQPFVVALMTQLAEVGPRTRVLEIGTGSGYQSAILSALGADVWSVEVIRELSDRARAAHERCGYDAVRLRVGDGFAGWPEQAPFEAILVTAAALEPPAPLVDQLANGGRMVLPVGPIGGPQVLRLLRRTQDGRLLTRDVLAVSFVPFVHDTH